jgi:WD40 repeat protein
MTVPYAPGASGHSAKMLWLSNFLWAILIGLHGLTIAVPIHPYPLFPYPLLSSTSSAQIISFSPWSLVTSVVWSLDGQTLAMATGNRIYLYQAAGLKPLNSLEVGAFTPSLAFDRQGALLAAGGHDGVLRLWRVADLPAASAEAPVEPIWQIAAHKLGVNSLVFSPDGRWLASGGNDAVARLWDVTQGTLIREIIGGTYAIPSIALSPDGQTLAIANGDVIRLRDTASGRITGSLLLQGWSYGLAYSADGLWLAAGSTENTLYLWDPATAYRSGDTDYPEPVILEGHQGKPVTYRALVWAVAFSPDGRRLASAGGDKTIRIWDPATGALLATLEGHTDAVTSLAFSPDGAKLLSGSLDGTIRIWRID